jgi:aspartate/methionine/tyrosine aminotransferase
LALEGKPIINMGIGSPDLRPSQSVIDAVALEDENAHQPELSGCQNCEKYG